MPPENPPKPHLFPHLHHLLNTLFSFLIFFLLLFIYTKLAGPLPFSISSTTTTKDTAFSVTGEGISTITPDSSTVSLGATANGSSAKEAQDNLNSKINKVITSIKALGIDEKSIQTQNYNVNPTYEFTSGTQKINGYSASTTLVIKLDDPKKASTVLDTAISNGANNINGVSFDNKDREKALDEARKQAIEDAKKKANKTADMAGFRLGKIISYSENTNGGIEPRIAYSTTDAAQKAPTQLEPGSNQVKVTVTLSYELF